MFGFGKKTPVPVSDQPIGPQYQIITMSDDLEHPITDEQQLQDQFDLTAETRVEQQGNQESKAASSPFLSSTTPKGKGPEPSSVSDPSTPVIASKSIPPQPTPVVAAKPQSIPLAPIQTESSPPKTPPLFTPQQARPVLKQSVDDPKPGPQAKDRPTQPIMREPGIRPIQPKPLSVTPTLEKIMASHDTYPIQNATPKPESKPKQEGTALSVTFDQDPPLDKAPIATQPMKNKVETDHAKEFFSPATEPAHHLPASQTAPGGTKILFILAIIIFIVTAGAGGYYYFFMQSPPSPEDQLAQDQQSEFAEPPTEPFEPTPLEPTPTVPQTPASTQPEIIEMAQPLVVQQNGLVESLKTVASGMKAQGALEKGSLYRLKNPQDLSLDPNEILSGLAIQLPEIKDLLLSGWIYVMLNKDASTRPALIFELSTDNQVHGIVQGLEPTLPERFKPLFIDGAAAAPLQAAFSPSQRDERIRFFNYAGDPTKSIDWGIITVRDKIFLIFATSKETMEMVAAELEATNE